MSEPIERRRWAIAEDYLPGWRNGPERLFTSHETACILNAGDHDAHMEITVFFADGAPVESYRVAVAARHTGHVRFNDLTDPEPIAVGAHYAGVI